MKKTALITGASSGIGLELAKILAGDGYDLVITARREDRLIELKNELEDKSSAEVNIITADLSLPESPMNIYQYCEDQNIQINVLANNAGIGDYGLFHDSDWQKTATMIDLNIKSLTHLTRLFLPSMIDRKKGAILNIASTASFQPGPLMSVYYATKHYVLAFSEAIANEVQEYGIKVTALCPGPTQSEFQATANMEKSKLMDRFPMPTSKDVAEYGYKAMKKGKRVAVHGFMNKMMSKVVRILPKKWVTATVRKIQERK
ncbi:SDR family NAD(P)-dependent oxidoreductase [Rhodohalobacter barkolensis]|uniref:Short-chain dehydrogenase n=1 Tax=Rhodohalobacter barkolensis TaxID=2053187 RepID=A0A2N0VJ18_9BACT|nr:SDR family oxidoreductase [Rhodohalobacter barkolensis]PKD44148.1 short-chain dehydrogenase [Rhodohalobacter barkolensis]